ncbi:MAG: hypothetical protein OXN44_06915 [Acidimicrobiaceae bacterium]|nr:hypothetical protein [Acidimicrobiaceae bacterium]
MSEQKRFELREELIEFIGQDKAETLMEALPPVSWDQLATKDDLNTLGDDQLPDVRSLMR